MPFVRSASAPSYPALQLYIEGTLCEGAFFFLYFLEKHKKRRKAQKLAFYATYKLKTAALMRDDYTRRCTGSAPEGER